jgi:hypothetical protein
LIFLDEPVGVVNHLSQIDDVLLQRVAHLIHLHQRVAIVIIVDALGTDRLGACLAKVVNDLRGMLRARNALNTAVNYWLRIVSAQEVYQFLISTAFSGCLLDDVQPACRASLHVLPGIIFLLLGGKIFWHLVHSLLVSIDDFHEARTAKSAAAVMEDKRWSKLQRFKALFFPLLVYWHQVHEALHRIEGLRAVVTQEYIIH